MNRYFLFFIWVCSLPVFAQQTRFPYTTLKLQDLNEFTTGSNWKIASDVFYDYAGVKQTMISPGSGILVNEISEKDKNHLFTNMQHGDIELELDFMMAKNSNAGVYLQGRYEVQMYDSWGIKNPKSTDCGAIYERWDDSKPEGSQGYEGHPPAQNVSKAPGAWQHFKIIFRAPRFNAKSEKTENARFLLVEHNGVAVHENVEVTGPTRAAPFEDEKPLGPLMIQGDHGPVAIKNIQYKVYGNEAVTLTNLTLDAYEGNFKSLSDFSAVAPSAHMPIEFLEHQGTEGNDRFAGKMNGTIHLPKSGVYFFQLNLKWIPTDTNRDAPNGGGEIVINGNKILSLNGTQGGVATAMVTLNAGDYPFVLSYYKTYRLWYASSNDIELGVETPGVHYSNLNAVLRTAEVVGAITLPVTDEPVIQRSFMIHAQKKKTHVLSVGEPGAINYAVDLSRGSLLQFWRGKFIETTLMWRDRGEPQLAQPLGSVIQLAGHTSLAFLNDTKTMWPDSNATYMYKGYEINKEGRPVFKSSIDKTQVRTFYEASSDGKKLSHSISVTQAPTDIWCNVAEGASIIKLPNGLFAIDNKQYFIELAAADEPIIRKTSQNTEQLLVRIKVKDNAGALKYSILW